MGLEKRRRAADSYYPKTSGRRNPGKLVHGPDCGTNCIGLPNGSDRIELYTEAYAQAYEAGKADIVLGEYQQAALKARELGIGVNAGMT